MTATEQVATELARLDPETRALLELSLRRQLSDEEIAALVRREPSEIAERRDEALSRLGLAVGESDRELRERLSQLSAEAWSGRPAGGNGRPEAPSRSLARPLALAALGVAVVAVIVLLATSGGGGESKKSVQGGGSKSKAPTEEASTPTATETTPSPSPTAAGPVVTMQVLNSTHGRGTAQLVSKDGQSRLRLRLNSFLTPRGGGYAVWLLNSRDDARRLYATSDTTIEIDLRLPSDYKRFKYVDVARAVPSLTSDHSGLSLLRAPIAELAR